MGVCLVVLLNFFFRLIEVKCSRVICAIRMVNIICLLLLFAEENLIRFYEIQTQTPGTFEQERKKRKQEWRKGCSLNMHVELKRTGIVGVLGIILELEFEIFSFLILFKLKIKFLWMSSAQKNVLGIYLVQF